MTVPTTRIALLFVAVATIAACSRKHVEPAPAPAGEPGAPPTQSQARTYDEVMGDVNSGTESYTKMAIAAAGYVRHLVPGKLIGVLQPDLKGPAFRDMVDVVTKAYAFRPIRSNEYRVVCSQPNANATGSATAATPICSMFLVDVVVQFEVAERTLDSGWVGGSTTQVPRGGTAAEESAFCITLARKGNEWRAIRSEAIDNRRRCPR
jgi:hypothetical protein